MGITCCKDCSDRKSGCHSICPRYQKQSAELKAFNERLRKEKNDSMGIYITRHRCFTAKHT